MTTLVEVVQREKISEPVIITPQVDALLSEVATFSDRSFFSFEIGTKHMERKLPVDSQILQELYARRILSALYYSNVTNSKESRVSAKFSYGRATECCRRLLHVASNGDGRPNWSLRAIISGSRTVTLAREEGDKAAEFFSSLYGAEQGLCLMSYFSKRGYASLPGWDYNKLESVVRAFLENLKILSKRVQYGGSVDFDYKGILAHAQRLNL